MSLSPAQLEELRKEFQTEFNFGDEHRLLDANLFQRNSEGYYINNFLEAAWRGYQMAVIAAYKINERFDPLRYIGPGLVGAFIECSEFEYDRAASKEEVEIWVHNDIRAALTACKQTPV